MVTRWRPNSDTYTDTHTHSPIDIFTRVYVCVSAWLCGCVAVISSPTSAARETANCWNGEDEITRSCCCRCCFRCCRWGHDIRGLPHHGRHRFRIVSLLVRAGLSIEMCGVVLLLSPSFPCAALGARLSPFLCFYSLRLSYCGVACLLADEREKAIERIRNKDVNTQ
jgi:hypothetical protein